VKRWLVVGAIVAFMVLAGAVAGGAITFGGGGGSGASGVSVVVSRDFGAKVIERRSSSSVSSGETVMRYMQRRFDVTTRYGGGFVQSIAGLPGNADAREDWFYYVNGIEADKGAASRKLADGDQVWWDHHDWQAAQRVPAVVGSWPEPFLSGEEGRQIPLAITCGGTERACDEVRTRLGEEDVKRVSSAGLGAGVGQKLLRIVVGPWKAIKDDPAASLLAKGPAASGVYARPTGAGIELLDEAGKVSRTLTGGGLIAATRFQDQQPTWIITGSDDTGVEAAAASLREDVLENRFAVAIDQGRGVPLPIRPVP
jgi:Domain of unknown function (DUF4430)